VGKRPGKGYTLERLDYDANYGPQNCVWMLKGFQARNSRRNQTYTNDGQTKTVAEWAVEYGVNPHTLQRKLKSGQSMEEAVASIQQHPPRKLLLYRGQWLTYGELEKIANVPRLTIALRINRDGATVEVAAETPVGSYFKDTST